MNIQYKTKLAFYSFLIFIFLATGCATIPPESVDLSKQIGSGISKSHSAHLSTIDAFYNQLNKDNDRWVVDVYLPKFISTSASHIEAACKAKGDNSLDCVRLKSTDLKTIISNTIKFRDEIQRTLSKNRDQSVRIINEHYNDLITANAGITGLLASAIDVSKATKDAAALTSKITGADIDTSAIEKALNKFLEKAGTEGAQITELEDNLSSIVKK